MIEIKRCPDLKRSGLDSKRHDLVWMFIIALFFFLLLPFFHLHFLLYFHLLLHLFSFPFASLTIKLTFEAVLDAFGSFTEIVGTVTWVDPALTPPSVMLPLDRGSSTSGNLSPEEGTSVRLS